jgi:hypothetical protein
VPRRLLLQIGWSKVQELRRYIKLFRDSGKFTIAYMKTAGEKEYYLASAFQELVIAPTANIRLAGFSVAGGWLGFWLCVRVWRVGLGCGIAVCGLVAASQST